MKKWILVFVVYLSVATAKDEIRDAKEKRQIVEQSHHPRRSPQPRLHSQLETIYGPQQGQFLIRAVGHSQQHRRPQQQKQHQSQRGSANIQQPEQQQVEEISPERYAYIPENLAGQYVRAPSKPVSQGKIPQHFIYEDQAVIRPDQQYQYLSEDQLLKLLEEELASPGGKGELDIGAKAGPITGSGGGVPDGRQASSIQSYQEVVPGPQGKPYGKTPPQNQYQQFFQVSPVEYHRSIPNHPLAESSLEKELEKLIASNKPTGHFSSQQHPRQTPHHQPVQIQTKTIGGAPAPDPQQNHFAFFPDIAQYTSYKPQIVSTPVGGESQYSQQQTRGYAPQPAEESEQKYVKVDQNGAQYFAEIGPQQPQRAKPNHSPFQVQRKPQPHYLTGQKPQNVDIGEGAMKIIQSPSLGYERQQVELSPAIDAYYKSQRQEKPQQQPQLPQPQPTQPTAYSLPKEPPSRSSIFVSQSTGIKPSPEPILPLSAYATEKSVRLPPRDGPPITQQEFQELIDAGYSVQAIPVPVPVPYDKFAKEGGYQFQEDQQPKGLRRQVPKGHRHQGVTYLHPLGSRQQSGSRLIGKGSAQ